MRCPDCRRQYSRFAVAPDAFRPTDELVCPHCGAGLWVGWWPAAGIAVVTVVTVVAVAASLWFGVGDMVARELGVSHRRLFRVLFRVAVATAIAAALFGPGMYAIWVFGWYARRPAVAGRGPAEPGAAPDAAAHGGPGSS